MIHISSSDSKTIGRFTVYFKKRKEASFNSLHYFFTFHFVIFLVALTGVHTLEGNISLAS